MPQHPGEGSPVEAGQRQGRDAAAASTQGAERKTPDNIGVRVSEPREKMNSPASSEFREIAADQSGMNNTGISAATSCRVIR